MMVLFCFFGHVGETEPGAEPAEAQRTLTDNGRFFFFFYLFFLIFALTLSKCICAILIDFQL